jgi:hypothetical protein
MYIYSNKYAFNQSYIQTNVLLKIQTETTRGGFKTPPGTTLEVNQQFTFTCMLFKIFISYLKIIVYF